MPIACIFTLRPEAAATVSPALGRAAHAVVLEQIAAADAALAARIHADDRVKPLTVAPMGALDGRGEAARVNPERTYDLRVTLLDPSLEALAARWTPEALPRLSMDGIGWRVERVVAGDGAHPWAGRASFDELLGGAMRGVARGAGGRWTIEFATPVTFRQSGRNQPLPLPELVFGSLLDRWNALAPLPLPAETRQFVAEGLAVSRFELRSAVTPTKGGAIQIGTVGRCTYVATNPDRYGRACVEALARFAFFSGVGAGTARGFGQARLAAEGRPATVTRPSTARDQPPAAGTV
jgi:CRISPR-associated endoribonuclease Cas6